MTEFVSIELHGLKELSGDMERWPKEVVDATARGLYSAANDIFNVSQEEVPVDTGTLRSSGFVSMPEVTSSGVQVTIGYGGAASSYAVEVHENLSAYHDPPTKAKYLEDPVNAGIPLIQQEVEAAILEALS